MQKDTDYYRDDALSTIGTSQLVSAVCFEALPKAVQYGFLNDIYDSDGDTIMAAPRAWFPGDGPGLVQAIFAQDTDRRYAARVLRKFADMLDGPHGYTISNMGLDDEDLNDARRLEWGGVQIECSYLEFLRWKKEQQEGEEWRPDNPEHETE
jgi:hypothetical protein